MFRSLVLAAVLVTSAAHASFAFEVSVNPAIPASQVKATLSAKSIQTIQVEAPAGNLSIAVVQEPQIVFSEPVTLSGRQVSSLPFYTGRDRGDQATEGFLCQALGLGKPTQVFQRYVRKPALGEILAAYPTGTLELLAADATAADYDGVLLQVACQADKPQGE